MENEIISLIEKGVVYFGTGEALGFDTVATLTVLKLKERYPQIKLILVLPCVNQAEKWSIKNIELYERIKAQADKIVYVSKDYTINCMHQRNRRLVDNSKYCICYYSGISGGTEYTIKYAKSKGLNIINCAD